MALIALVAILYFLIGAFVCLLICVNPNKPGPLGAMRRFIFNTLPDKVSNIIRKLFGERVLRWVYSAKVYFMETNHPIVQWFYYLIAVGGFIAYSINGIFAYMPNRFISDAHIVVAYVMAGFCFWVYYKACSVSPGEVTNESSPQLVYKYKSYYDGLIYKYNNKCKTCDVIKPARSKHCNVCKMCVSKFDHHCVWIRQCVGQRNYKYFITFLFSHSIWTLYLSIIGSVSLFENLHRMNFWNLQFRIGNEIVRGNNWLALQYLFIMDTLFFFIIIMCAIMGVTLLIFVSYHFYLIKYGQTTNERVKKNDYIAYLKKYQKYIKKVLQAHPEGLPEKIQYGKEKITRKDFEEHKEDVNYRLAILEKYVKNPGFWANLKVIFSEPDK